MPIAYYCMYFLKLSSSINNFMDKNIIYNNLSIKYSPFFISFLALFTILVSIPPLVSSAFLFKV